MGYDKEKVIYPININLKALMLVVFIKLYVNEGIIWFFEMFFLAAVEIPLNIFLNYSARCAII